jgi:hypothetical protein
MMRAMSTLRLQSVRDRAVFAAPIRFGLGIALLVAARVAGAAAGPALVGFAVGALGFALALLVDPRRRFMGPKEDPEPLPDDARLDTPARSAFAALFPSTVGVAALAVIALPRSPVLSALLAGGLAGMGVATLVAVLRVAAWEHQLGGSVWIEHRTHALYIRRG